MTDLFVVDRPDKPEPSRMSSLFLGAAIGGFLAVVGIFAVIWFENANPVAGLPGRAVPPVVGDCITAKTGGEDQRVVPCDDPYASFKVLAVYPDDEAPDNVCVDLPGVVGLDVWGEDDVVVLCEGPTH